MSSKRLISGLVAAFVAAVAALAPASASNTGLASRLVVAKADVPSHWGRFSTANDGLMHCLDDSRAPSSERAQAIFGTPNSGVWSHAAVLRTEKEAVSVYASASRRIQGCVGGFLRTRQPAAHDLGKRRKLRLGHYGESSQASRLRFWLGPTNRSLDWAIVRTGRAVLVDVFLVAYFDALGRERTTRAGFASVPESIALERTMLRKALARS